MWDWLIDHVPGLSGAVERRLALSVPGGSETPTEPEAPVLAPEEARRRARVADAMEQDAAARYVTRRPPTRPGFEP